MEKLEGRKGREKKKEIAWFLFFVNSSVACVISA
jgi:hypothetical protein